MVATQTESPPEVAQVGRPQENEPDPNTPRGQWALWVRHHMPENDTGCELAAAVGKGRSTGFNWLGGQNVPDVSLWPEIAVYLGLPSDWRSLVPPDRFVRYVTEHNGELPPKRR